MASSSYQEIHQELSEKLSEHRFKHTLSVQDCAKLIFETNFDTLNSKDRKQVINKDDFLTKLELAAILHDSCKELQNDEQLKLAKFYGIKIFDEDLESPNLLHARVGAKVVEEKYDIIDPYILKAIEEHTLGGIDMLLSSKILFLADFIEPLRKSHSELENIRELAFQEKDLDTALLKAMESKIAYVIFKGQKIHPLAIKARNSLV